MDTISSAGLGGVSFDEWHDKEARRCCLEWAMERSPTHASADDILSVAREFARFIYGGAIYGGANESGPLPSQGPDEDERKVVHLHKDEGEPEDSTDRVFSRWEVESGLVAFSSIKGNGAVVSVCRGPGGFPNLTVSIGGMDIKSPIPEAAMSEIIKIFNGGGGKTCA